MHKGSKTRSEPLITITKFCESVKTKSCARTQRMGVFSLFFRLCAVQRGLKQRVVPNDFRWAEGGGGLRFVRDNNENDDGLTSVHSALRQSAPAPIVSRENPSCDHVMSGSGGRGPPRQRRRHQHNSTRPSRRTAFGLKRERDGLHSQRCRGAS